MLQTDQLFLRIDSNQDALVTNKDGSVDVYFASEPPKGHENNWM